MGRKTKIDPHGEAAVVITVRFAKDIIEMLDLLSSNRSEFVREATYEKIEKTMKEGSKHEK